LEHLDIEQYVEEKNKKVEKKQKELLERLQVSKKNQDFFVRAVREAEVPLLKKKFEKDKEEDKKFYESQLQDLENEQKLRWEKAVEGKKYFQKMLNDKLKFDQILLEKKKT